jgi:uncharacterized membrane protein YphA (DoxX/SURF4 family)
MCARSSGGLIMLCAIADAWQAFFHAPVPATSVGLFRLLFGLVMVANTLLLFGDARRLLGPDGMLNAEHYRQKYGRRRFTLYALLPQTDASVYALLGVQLVAAVCLAAGLWTRLSAAVTFLMLVSYANRNPAMTYGGDSVARLLALLLIFAPAGQAVSVDALLAGAAGPLPAGEGLCSPWCLRLMQLQVAIIYLRTVYWKLRGRTWRDGTAAYYPTQLVNYRRLVLPRWALNPVAIRVATWGTLAVESALATLVWVPECRYYVLAAGAAFHLLLEVLLNLQLFGVIMLASLTVLIDPCDAQRWLAALNGWLSP